jgi:hypothetical protein
MLCVKLNIVANVDKVGCVLRSEGVTVKLDDGTEGSQPRIRYLGKTFIKPDEVAQAGQTSKAERTRREARRKLKQLLQNGPVPVMEVHDMLESLGIGRDRRYAIINDLDTKTEPDGYGGKVVIRFMTDEERGKAAIADSLKKPKRKKARSEFDDQEFG